MYLLAVISKFRGPHLTYFIPNGRGDVLDIVVHKDVRLSEVRILDIMDSDHLHIIFCILDHIKAWEILDPVEKFTDWERFQSLASALVSPRMEINSCIEADKAARVFAASIASAYRLSTKTTTISGRNRGSSSLESLLKQAEGHEIMARNQGSSMQDGGELSH
jgi:hypothetical protein